MLAFELANIEIIEYCQIGHPRFPTFFGSARQNCHLILNLTEVLRISLRFVSKLTTHTLVFR